MKRLLVPILLVSLLALFTGIQAEQMTNRPLLIKLGPAPNAHMAGLVAGRFKTQLANGWVTRVLFYYGSLVDVENNRFRATPEFYNMYKFLQAALALDPYNMDAYYFSQAAFTWGLGRVKEVNALLEHGMKYRTWDYWLPFYAGFNASYFLHDYEEGARFMEIAAERSGNSLPTQLAARYFYQAHETELGIIFLKTVLKQVRNENLRKVYETRLAALMAVREIETASKAFREKFGYSPEKLDQMVKTGFLVQIPDDPYGGRFFLGKDGLVESTSQFAFVDKGKDSH
jgi:hypothetical protein